MAKNIAYIFQPHFKTMKLRPSCSEQRGTDFNYVVVTCSPSYNGIWKWDATKKEKYETWNNNNRLCYCVPLSECVKVKELDEITNPEILNGIAYTRKLWEDLKNKNKSAK